MSGSLWIGMLCGALLYIAKKVGFDLGMRRKLKGLQAFLISTFALAMSLVTIVSLWVIFFGGFNLARELSALAAATIALGSMCNSWVCCGTEWHRTEKEIRELETNKK